MYSHIFDKHLPGYSLASEEEQSSLWDLASPTVIYELNADIQIERGQGADKLSMCEFGRVDEKMGDYADLLSYDIVHWVEQQHRIYNRFPEMVLDKNQGLKVVHSVPSGYINEYSGDWIRLFYKDKFTYGNLYSVSRFILGQVEERVERWLDGQYPHKIIVHIEPNEKTEHYPATFTSDNQEHCAKVTKIKLALRPYYLQLQEELIHRLNAEPVATYLIERQDQDGFPMVDFICHNDMTLRLVRPLSFVQDMARYLKSNEILDTLIEEFYLKVQMVMENEMANI